MSNSAINRRDFLKLLGAASLAWMGSASLSGSLPGSSIAAGQAEIQPSPNILLLVFDSLAAPNMSLYGYPRQTTPNLEKLAEHALVYRRHYSGGNFTSPGTASLLTGLYPWTHRALPLRSQVLEKYANHSIFHFLPPSYHRFAYTQNPFAFVLLHQFRQAIDNLLPVGELALQSNLLTDTLFYPNYYAASEAELLIKSERTPSVSLFLSLLDHFKLHLQTGQLEKTLKEQFPRGIITWGSKGAGVYNFRLEDAIDWVIGQARTASRPYFGYVHVLPPHPPYNPRVEFSELFDDGWQPPEKPLFQAPPMASPKALLENRRQYDQYLAYVDAEIGRLFQALKESGALENTLVVLTSDHGEMFERGILSHITPALYEPIAHIPLLLFPPGQKNRLDIDTTTSAVDLLPTIMKLAGGALPTTAEGQELPFAPGVPAAERGVYVMEAKSNPKRAPLTKASFALVQWPYKLTQYSGYPDLPGHYELYDLDADAEELHNLYSPQDPTAQRLQQMLSSSIAKAPQP
jgi:hypothetical protein